MLENIYTETSCPRNIVREKISPLLFHQILLLLRIAVFSAVLKNSIRIYQTGQLRARINHTGIPDHKVIRRINNHRIMEYTKAFVQHFLDASLLISKLIKPLVPLAVIFKKPLNLIEKHKRRGIVHKLKYLPVLSCIPRAHLSDTEQHGLLRHYEVLLGHLILRADIDFVILHTVSVAEK